VTVVAQTLDAETTAAADEPLLSYTVTTTPSPLKASPENPQAPEETGEIVIAIARQSGTPADAEWIKVKIPAGTMAPDLAIDLAKISPRITLTGWTVRLDTAAKEFVFSPAAGHTPIGPDTGFTIQLSDIPMSRKVGTSPVTVTERSRTGSSAFQNRVTVFQLGKFPADFYLRNFQCEPSVIHNGGNVELTWERSANATYELLYSDVNRDVTNRSNLPLEGIRSDTTFYLRATTGDPTNPVTRILSTQVTVLKPDLDVGSLTVHGTLTANGPITANGTVTSDSTLTLTAEDIALRGRIDLVNESPTLIQDFGNISMSKPFTAESSGMIVFTGFNGNRIDSGIQFFLKIKANEIEASTTIDPMDTGSSSLLLNKGARAEITLAYRGASSTAGFTGKAYWIPLGAN
jgi:hypothetical protein